MPIKSAFKIADALTTPVSLYCSEVWTPHILKNGSLSNVDSLLKNWEDFIPEKINQRISRLLLSVHKKTSRLAVLGELGRFPLIINAIIHTIKYEWHLKHKTPSTSLVGGMYNEMQSNNNHKMSVQIAQSEFWSNIT